jgi:hypothetical protein
MSKKLTTEEFIQKAKQIHNDKYDYSKVEYINTHTKICIICPEHGEFWQTPDNHLHDRGCSKCTDNYKPTTKEFIQKAIDIHGHKYDYSKVNYINNETKIIIICSKHGHFLQRPLNHICLKNGCPKCETTYLKTSQEFIQKAIDIHGHKYNYSKVNYINCNVKICIICLKHGEFWQTPHHHLEGSNCPKCQRSKGEEQIEKYLQKYNIQFETQKRFTDCKYKNSLPFDFYLPHFNTCIEFQGRQHYIPIFGIQSLNQTQTNDNLKDQYCFNNCIKFIKIPFNQQNQIEKLLSFLIS